MTSSPEIKLTGINTWFIIEILSFYGYILSAIVFIFQSSLKSSFSTEKNPHLADRYKSDFVAYHKKDLDWLAFVSILFNVNIGLIAIDEYIIFANPSDREGKEFPLRWIVIQLLGNHLLQMVFLKDFYDKNRKVNTGHRWVWYVHLVSYAYIIIYYCFTDAKDREASESSKIWVPLEIILTFNIALYQLYYNFE